VNRDLQIEIVRPGVELTLAGRLDARTSGDARSVLHEALEEGAGDLLVHIGDLEIWDAGGLGVIVGVHRRAGHGGRRLILLDVPAREQRLLRATRLHRVLLTQPAAVA
jgi:anti-sigma B factor antagonist